MYFSAFDNSTLKWYKDTNETDVCRKKESFPIPGDPKRFNSTCHLRAEKVENNGTYFCEVQDKDKTARGNVSLLVLAKPKVVIDKSTGISTSKIYVNFTVLAYNCDMNRYDVYIRKENEYSLVTDTRISRSNTSFILNDLNKTTNYILNVKAITTFNDSGINSDGDFSVETLDFDPVFVPKISINGFSATSVTIGWKTPEDKVAPFIHYYILEARKKHENVTRRAYHSRDGRNLPYMFDNLEPHSTYIFKVKCFQQLTVPFLSFCIHIFLVMWKFPHKIFDTTVCLNFHCWLFNFLGLRG